MLKKLVLSLLFLGSVAQAQTSLQPCPGTVLNLGVPCKQIYAVDITPGTTAGLDILGIGNGSLTLPANMPTYYGGFLAPGSGTPQYLLQLPSATLSAGFWQVSAPVSTTFNTSNGGTTTVPVSQVTSGPLPTDIALTDATNVFASTNTFSVPSGCTGGTVYFLMNGMQGKCNGTISHNNYEEWLGATTYSIFKTVTTFVHVTGNSNTPTIAAGAGAASCAVAGNDIDFTITATMSSSPVSGTLCTVTFGQAYVTAPPRVTWGSNNAISSAALTSVYKSATLTTLTFTTSNALTASGSYSWDLHLAN